MTLSSLDPKTALIVVDLQRGFSSLSLAHPFHAVVARAAVLASAFRTHELPVVIVNNEGAAPGRREQDVVSGVQQAGWAEIVAELGVEASDRRITKRSPGAFTGTKLLEWLQANGVTQVVIAGIATGTGVEMTARQAYEAGFNVTLAIDAMTDMDADVHDNSVTKIFPRIGESASVDQIIEALQSK